MEPSGESPEKLLMNTDKTTINRLSFNELKELIDRKWPQTNYAPVNSPDMIFSTGLASLDAAFPAGGIPYGQLIEIGGSPSSGKTSLLFKLLASLSKTGRVAYLDFDNSFYPAAAVAGGIDIERLLVVRPNDLRTGTRSAELLFRHRAADTIVFDLVGCRQPLPEIMMHRLRRRTVRAKGLLFFLTENNSHLIPTSMVSLSLQVRRKKKQTIEITIAKSRISKEQLQIEVALDGP